MLKVKPMIVFCTWMDEQGEDPITFTRVHGNQHFCANCGASDHEEVK